MLYRCSAQTRLALLVESQRVLQRFGLRVRLSTGQGYVCVVYIYAGVNTHTLYESKPDPQEKPRASYRHSSLDFFLRLSPFTATTLAERRKGSLVDLWQWRSRLLRCFLLIPLRHEAELNVLLRAGLYHRRRRVRWFGHFYSFLLAKGCTFKSYPPLPL